jgi:4-amino-4-deoxy-L-arabinose transferase-like glycosyltransferase
MAKIWRYLCLATAAVGCVLAIRFTALFWDSPWPDPILTIDGKSYLSAANGATLGNLFDLSDFYHSPGYQIFLRLLFAIFGSSESMIHAAKILSLLMFFASALMIYRIGRRWFGSAVAEVAIALFLLSESWTYYCNMIQYEVLAGFLMLLFLSMLTAGEFTSQTKTSWRLGIGMGLVLAFLTLIQMRYAVLVLVPLIYAAILHRTRAPKLEFRYFAIMLGTLFLVLSVWSLVQSLIHGRTIMVADGSKFRIHVSNNPNALGYSFPYPEVIEPSGWQFILSMPGQWLWLVGQRALYLFGVKRDIWALPPQGFGSGPIGSYSPLDVISMILAAAGLSMVFIRILRGELTAEPIAAILMLVGVMLPPLLIFGSKRFIVPVIPLVALFQGYGIVAIGAGIYRACLAPRSGTSLRLHSSSEEVQL